MGKVRLSAPPEFAAACVGMRTVEAAAIWGVSEPTARRWFAESGTKPRHAKSTGRPSKKRPSGDTPSQIAECLNCDRKDCTGYCVKVARLGR